MNREIKFRAWDNIEGRMSQEKGIENLYFQSGSIQGKHITFPTGSGAFIMVPSSDCTIMQFTGLHDCTGKPIYEGDIVKWGHLPNSKELTERIAEVRWGNGGFEMVAHNLARGWHPNPFQPSVFKMQTFAYSFDQVEVIGDIFTTPHLLK